MSSSHWKLGNTPQAPLSRDEASSAVAELLLGSQPLSNCSPSSSDLSRRTNDVLLAVLSRLQVPLCRTARRIVSEFGHSFSSRQFIPKTGEPVVPVQDFLRLLSQLKFLHSMWRTTVVSQANRQRLASPELVNGNKFFADDLAEALQAFCDPGESHVSLPRLETAVNDIFGEEVIEAAPIGSPASNLGSPLELTATVEFSSSRIDVPSVCRLLLCSDFVTAENEGDDEDYAADNFAVSPTPSLDAQRKQKRVKPGEERIEFNEFRTCARRLELEKASRAAIAHAATAPAAAAAASELAEAKPPAGKEVKPIQMSREGQHAPRGGSFAHGPERATEIAASTDGGLLLVSSIDVPKCPKNLRLGPDSDSDDCGTGRKSSRRLSRGNTSRLSARFRSAALLAAASNLQSHRALGPLIGSTSPPATNRPQTRTHEMTSSQQHFATRKSSPLPQQQQSPPPRPQTRGRSPPSLTHRRSVSPAVGVLPPSLGMHSALSNPTYERCKQSFPKRTIQFR